jgi:hypothetical protein
MFTSEKLHDFLLLLFTCTGVCCVSTVILRASLSHTNSECRRGGDVDDYFLIFFSWYNTVCPPFQLERVLDRAARSHSLSVKLGALSAARSVGTEMLVTQEVHTNGTVKISSC